MAPSSCDPSLGSRMDRAAWEPRPHGQQRALPPSCWPPPLQACRSKPVCRDPRLFYGLVQLGGPTAFSPMWFLSQTLQKAPVPSISALMDRLTVLLPGGETCFYSRALFWCLYTQPKGACGPAVRFLVNKREQGQPTASTCVETGVGTGAHRRVRVPLPCPFLRTKHSSWQTGPFPAGTR